jgi:glucose/arabinose dehydrogenase
MSSIFPTFLPHHRGYIVLALSTLLLVVIGFVIAHDTVQVGASAAAVGDPLPRIQCVPGYSAIIYAEGLSGPDGLAFGPNGNVFVAEETAGEVSQIGPSGLVTAVLTGVVHPEGIVFDSAGNLYVVEDITGGRVVKRNPAGVTSTVVSGLAAPEGIVWVEDGSSVGLLYVTESNIEHAFSISSTNASDYRTYVTAVSLTGAFTRVLTTTAIVTVGFPIEAQVWSYSGLTVGPDGRLYVANELAGQEVMTSYMGIPFHAFSSESLFAVLTTTIPATRTAFTDNGLLAPEGPRFSVGGNFPLYVAEENIGNGEGRVSQVMPNGSHTPFCSGFFGIEDVLQAPDGSLYVSEDTSGLVIRIQTHQLYLPLVRR